MLDAGGFDPTVINGGIINAYGTNARRGQGDWMVGGGRRERRHLSEIARRYRGRDHIDAEHLDHFKTFDAIKEAFRTLVENLPFYGFAVMCLDHPVVQELVGRIEDRRVVTYGENPQADVRLLDIDLSQGVSRFNVLIRDRKTSAATYIEDVVMPMPGHHNALNATAAIAVAIELKVPIDTIRSALRGFGGVKRRFTRVGEWNGALIFDDYGHHPVEIAAVLRAARASTRNQVIAVVQPHRYSRLQSLFNDFATCFNDADVGGRGRRLSGRRKSIPASTRPIWSPPIKAHGHRNVVALDTPALWPVSSHPWPNPATTWSASGPATSRNGPMLYRANSEARP